MIGIKNLYIEKNITCFTDNRHHYFSWFYLKSL